MAVDAYSPQITLAVCIAFLAILLIVVWGVSSQINHRRTVALRGRFGPEYDVAVREYGRRRKAEDVLETRTRHVAALKLRPLDDGENRQYRAEWDCIYERFVDHPRGAVMEADELIGAILSARGYTGGRFDQRVAELSVHHARLADPYRRGNAIAVKAGRNEATAEELRSAMMLYRTLLDELVQTKTVSMRQAQAA